MKSTLEEIEKRFDQDVARFSNLDTGQATIVDAALQMDLITDSIRQLYPNLQHILDIGCGAGNYDVKLLQGFQNVAHVDLVDLSQPMLDKAVERIQPLTQGKVQAHKGDFSSIALPENQYDVIIATAVLHHLRSDADWQQAIQKLYKLLKPGGSIWVCDMIEQAHSGLQNILFKQRYGKYLSGLKDDSYRDHVFAYIEKEDSPRSLNFQMKCLEEAGFRTVDLLHKNLCFASYCGFKPE